MKKKKNILFKLLLAALLLVCFAFLIIAETVEQTKRELFLLSKKMNEVMFEDIGGIILPLEVELYREAVRTQAQAFGKEEYVDLFLAVMAQESKGLGDDVFNCSENLGIQVDKPSESIFYGVYYLSCYIDLYCESEEEEEDDEEGDTILYLDDIEGIRLVVQTYNFGEDFMYYAKSLGGWSQRRVNKYAEEKSGGEKRTDPEDIASRGIWDYGDQYYTDKVLRYYIYPGLITDNNDRWQAIRLAYDQLGKPYKLGEEGPDKFDCSGLVYYCYSNSGYNISRQTADDYYHMCFSRAENNLQPGDLVFYREKGSSKIEHVAIYVGKGPYGGGLIIHARNPKKGVCLDYYTYDNTRERIFGYFRAN